MKVLKNEESCMFLPAIFDMDKVELIINIAKEKISEIRKEYKTDGEKSLICRSKCAEILENTINELKNCVIK